MQQRLAYDFGTIVYLVQLCNFILGVLWFHNISVSTHHVNSCKLRKECYDKCMGIM